MPPSRIYLSPGFFGFRRIGTTEYFVHIEAGLRRRFRDAGREVDIHIVDNHPSASIRRRAARVAAALDETAGDEGPLHLVGHSTGGLDARLVASPSGNVGGSAARWGDRLVSVTTINTPHYGTPLASFFATLSGQRMLYALSALGVVGLELGRPPLALTSSLVAILRRLDDAMVIRLSLIDGLTDAVVRLLDSATSAELRGYLRQVRDDQGAVIQLSPEAMDLFDAAVEDRPGVRYQSTASWAPVAGITDWARAGLIPWTGLSMVLFAMIQRLSAAESAKYRCASPHSEDAHALESLLGALPPESASDGIIPVRSQVWGRLVWAGLGDHLDVVGHFHGGRRHAGHRDWFASGARYDRHRFETQLDAIARGMLDAEADQGPR